MTCMTLYAGRDFSAVPCDVSMFETVHAQTFLTEFGHLLVGEQRSEDVAFFRLMEAVADRTFDGWLRLRRRVGDLVGEGRRLLSLTLV